MSTAAPSCPRRNGTTLHTLRGVAGAAVLPVWAGVVLALVLGRMLRPVLTIHRAVRPRADDDQQTATLRPPPEDPRLVRTTLHNTGLGPAIVRAVVYEVQTTSGLTHAHSSIRSVVDFLREHCNAVDDEDFFLFGISDKWTLAPVSEQHIASLTLPLANQLSLFRITLTHRSVLGWVRGTTTLNLLPSDPSQRPLPSARTAAAA